MILKTQAIKVLLLAATFLIASCVEIPSEGHTPPDYHSEVRVLNVLSGSDTIAILQYASDRVVSDTTSSETVIIPPDTLTVLHINDSTISHATYKRVDVDFSTLAWQVVIDDESLPPLSLGDATSGPSYLNIPSGARLIKMIGTGNLVDSLAIKDTVAIVRIDTIPMVGLTIRDTVSARDVETTTLFPLTGPTTEVLDSVDGRFSFQTERKGTFFLMGNDGPLTSIRDDMVRFGRVNYLWGDERYTFAPGGEENSTLIRFAHASALVDTSVSVMLDGSAIATVARFNKSAYVELPAAGDTSYTFSLIDNGTSMQIGSDVVVATSSGKRHTVVVYDDTPTTTMAKIYEDD